MQKSRRGRNTYSNVIATAIGAAFVLSVVACESSTGIPRRAAEFTPPAAYLRWWTMTQKCAGKDASFASLRWYRVQGSQFKYDGHDVRGYYDPAENAIVLSDSLAAFAAGVRHEMLHAVDGAPGHPRDLFQDDCAKMVTCPMTCEEDGGTWQAPEEWVPMKSDSLRIAATAELLPADIDGERWLVIRTSVTNPLPQAVVAVMPPTYAFEFKLTSKAGNGDVQDAIYAVDSSAYYFKANETKEFLFELRVGEKFSRYEVPPGEYAYSGGFGCHWSVPEPIKVEQ